MNWVKANKFLTGFIIVMVIGIAILGYEVYAASDAYDNALNTYGSTAAEYSRLRHLGPFPSEANLQQYGTQEQEAAKAIDAFEINLSKNEFPLDPLTPEGFQDKLKASVTEIRKKAVDASVKLPEKFFLGFDKYETTPPKPEAAGPLGRQLKAIEWVVGQYIDNKVLEINALVRSELPEERGLNDRRERSGYSGGGRPPGTGGTGGPGGSRTGGSEGRSRRDLVQYNYFDLTAICHQDQLDNVLNSFTGAKAPQFYVLRQIHIRNQNEKGPAKSTPAPESGKPEGTKYIVGDELIEAVARIDIVDFNPPSEASAETEKATPPTGKQP